MSCEQCGEKQRRECAQHGPFDTDECAASMGIISDLSDPDSSELFSIKERLQLEAED